MKTILLYLITIPFFFACANQQAKNKSDSTEIKVSVDSIRFNAKTTRLLPKDEVTKNYSQAIAEYIKAVRKKGEFLPDTLFIGKNVEFPEIILPRTIEGINMKQMTPDDAKQYLQNRKSWLFLNVIGFLSEGKSEFIIISFPDDWKPKHNCSVYFTHHSDKKEFVLDSLNFEED